MTIPLDKQNMPADRRPTWANIDLDALASNFHAIRNRLNRGVKVIAVVKANAYGNGSAPVSRMMASHEGRRLVWGGVARRGNRIRFGYHSGRFFVWPAFGRFQAAACIQNSLFPVVYRFESESRH